MLKRAVTWAVRSYVGGPARSWVFSSVALGLIRLVTKTTGRREVVDLSSIKPGQKVVIEHLDISHKKQIKQIKKDKKRAKREAKAG